LDGAKSQISGAQAGLDMTLKSVSTEMTLGVFHEYMVASMEQSKNVASTDTRANGFGFYNQMRGGNWYADAVLRASFHDYTISAPGHPDFSTKGESWGGTLEAGYTFISKKKVFVEPQIQISYETHGMDDAVDPVGRVYHLEKAKSLEGRIGLRIWDQLKWKKNVLVRPYARGSIIHEFEGGSSLAIGDRTFANNLTGGGVMADAGASIQIGGRFQATASGMWLAAKNLESYSLNFNCSYMW
jgi:outer membrane autotransporter protein